jgi:NAD(P)-dependent dehydrogenase (short-subunit alcohol dehydrogenase family)
VTGSAVVVGGPEGVAGQVAEGLRALGTPTCELIPASRAELAAAMGRANVDQAAPLRLVVCALSPPADQPLALTEHDAAGWDARACQPLRDAVACFQAAGDAFGHAGTIVAVLPTLAMSGSAGFTAWSTAAEGLRSLVKVTAREYGKRSITVNAVALPAAVIAGSATSLDRPGLPAAKLPVPESAAGRVAEIIYALSAPPWTAVTGATIAVDGGVWMPA